MCFPGLYTCIGCHLKRFSIYNTYPKKETYFVTPGIVLYVGVCEYTQLILLETIPLDMILLSTFMFEMWESITLQILRVWHLVRLVFSLSKK